MYILIIFLEVHSTVKFSKYDGRDECERNCLLIINYTTTECVCARSKRSIKIGEYMERCRLCSFYICMTCYCIYLPDTILKLTKKS